MDIYAIRKQNLINLIGTRRKNACALKWEMAPAHLSQILSDRTEKNLGDDVARRIESLEGLERGWMDQLRESPDQVEVVPAGLLGGAELGAAIEAARIKKGITKKDLAAAFGVAAPSVQGWVNTGRIDKSKLIEVIRYFADVVGPDHWGLSKGDGDLLQVADTAQAEPQSAADMVRAMLATKAGKALPKEARERLLGAAEDHPAPTTVRAAPAANGEIVIPQYDIRASMGHGQVAPDYAEIVRNVIVKESYLQENGITFTSPAHLAMITGWGQSMEGTINDKDPLIVDRGINEFVGDGIYVLTWNDHLYIKRLQMVDKETIELISDNPKHKDREVPLKDVTIHARVLLIWNAKKA
ncbi:LexA family transcriptional regulator [Pseudomonas tohonis]|uniref:LexA family transcriptional regulator n=1 Tax=Pseudomonas tohonis TaxID=2725477 RepID=UPI001F3B37FD|nr:XRE family transcriptional regulator [Pseudomonas tohonis]